MNIEEINLKVSELIKEKIGIVKFNTWFKVIKNAYMDENNIIIPVPNDFHKGVIEERYLELFNDTYRLYKEHLGYDKIIIKTDKNIEQVFNEQEEYVFNAKEMKKIADKRNSELIDIEKEAEEALEKIFREINIRAEWGDYSTICYLNKNDLLALENIIRELKRLGFKVEKQFSEGINNIIDIQWNCEEYEI